MTASGAVIDVIVISRRPLFVSDTNLIDADHTAAESALRCPCAVLHAPNHCN